MVSIWFAMIMIFVGIIGGYIVGTWNSEHDDEVGEFIIVKDGDDYYFAVEFYDDVDDSIFLEEDHVSLKAKWANRK